MVTIRNKKANTHTICRLPSKIRQPFFVSASAITTAKIAINTYKTCNYRQQLLLLFALFAL